MVEIEKTGGQEQDFNSNFEVSEEDKRRVKLFKKREELKKLKVAKLSKIIDEDIQRLRDFEGVSK